MQIDKEKKKEFIKNSNLIEEINIDEKYYDSFSHSSFPEIRGHSLAFDYMVDNCESNLSENHVLEMHRLLTKNIVSPIYCGKYRNIPVFIAGRMGAFPVAIKPEMQELMKEAKKAKTEDEIWNCHFSYECIHPFADGNGRSGRLILAWLFLKNDYELPIVKIEERQDYYAKIEKYRIEKYLDNK